MGGFKMIGNNTDKLEEDLAKKENYEAALTEAMIEDIELSLRDLHLSKLKYIYLIIVGEFEFLELEKDLKKELSI